MNATAEISLYPLTEEYEQVVIDFIQEIKQNPNLEVEVNGLSTQIFGDYEEIMDCLKENLMETLENNKAVFVMKIAKGLLKKEDLPGSIR